MALYAALVQICNQPALADVVRDLVLFISPLWFALFFGVLLGWTWKPNWVKFDTDFLLFDSKSLKFVQLPNCVSWISDALFEKEMICSQENLGTSACRLVFFSQIVNWKGYYGNFYGV